MPVYEYQGERVEAVQWNKFDDHVYTRQLKPGEFAEELPEVKDPRPSCAALDQPGEAPLLVRPGDFVVSRPAEHGELRCEVVPADQFLKAAEFVGVPDAAMRAGMSASPEHQERREKHIQADLDRQVETRKRLQREAEQRQKEGDRAAGGPSEPAPQQTSGQPGSPQAATLGRVGEDGRPAAVAHGRGGEREAKPQPAGADGNRGAKPGEPDPDAHRAAAAHGKAKR